MSKKKGGEFASGGLFFVLGLVELYNRHFESTILLCGFGIVLMADGDRERTQQLWDFFFGGFKKLLEMIFSIFR